MRKAFYNSIFDQIRRISVMILLFGLIGVSAAGQENTPGIESNSKIRNEQSGQTAGKDSIFITGEFSEERERNFDELEHSPRKAMIYGLILPGLGQVYNKKYFKIPIVYAALGGVGYWVYFNANGYRQITVEYTNDPSDYNERYLRLWRRQLELSYISLVGAYALQVLDAYVDANLFYWDVNPDLTIRMEPALDNIFLPSGEQVANFGLKCKLTF
ncbi:DUF5683 domain-containing protein [Bacteroidota bacterium]